MRDVLLNCPFILTFTFNDNVVNKPDFHWTKETKQK